MTSNPDGWNGRTVMRARAIVATWLPAPCGRCGETIASGDKWVVGHKVARSVDRSLINSVSNWQPEHRSCSDKSAQAAVVDKARREGALAVLDFLHDGLADQPEAVKAVDMVAALVRAGQWDFSPW